VPDHVTGCIGGGNTVEITCAVDRCGAVYLLDADIGTADIVIGIAGHDIAGTARRQAVGDAHIVADAIGQYDIQLEFTVCTNGTTYCGGAVGSDVLFGNGEGGQHGIHRVAARLVIVDTVTG